MDDARLFELLLELKSPWFVASVQVDKAVGRVDVRLEHKPGARFACPECQQACPVHDHGAERCWRHLDTMQHQTFLHARGPRVRCAAHGVRQAQLPWAGPGARLTELFETKIVDTLGQLQNITATCRVLSVSWDQVFGVMKRAVDRGLRRRELVSLKKLGVDEKAWKKAHRYFTVLADLDRKAVVDLARDRKTQSLDDLYLALPEGVLGNVQAVAMDMWQAFLTSTLKHVPQAEEKIVHDRFHCVQMLLKAVDQVRAAEHRRLKKDNRNDLARARYAVGKNPENLTTAQHDKLDAILAADLQTGKAWSLKENARRLWEAPDAQAARERFEHWCQEVEASGLKPMIKVARAFKVRSKQILNWFEHLVSTGIVEALNGQIMAIKRKARGHRNFDNLRTAILFFLGKLDLTMPK